MVPEAASIEVKGVFDFQGVFWRRATDYSQLSLARLLVLIIIANLLLLISMSLDGLLSGGNCQHKKKQKTDMISEHGLIMEGFWKNLDSIFFVTSFPRMLSRYQHPFYQMYCKSSISIILSAKTID